MGKLYTDTLHKYDAAKKSEEVEIAIPDNILAIYLFQGIKIFLMLTLVYISGKITRTPLI
ncbi:MAG: hypothetical protein ACTSYA_11590 [Candidatus Kariarchaeaceae archaeon]